MKATEKNFQKIKNVILFIYNYECYSCKTTSNELHVHHINHNHEDNDVYNLIPLCRICHMIAHKGLMLKKPTINDTQFYLLEKLAYFQSIFIKK